MTLNPDLRDVDPNEFPRPLCEFIGLDEEPCLRPAAVQTADGWLCRHHHTAMTREPAGYCEALDLNDAPCGEPILPFPGSRVCYDHAVNDPKTDQPANPADLPAESKP